jgi:sulfate adenylyltransferase
MTIPDGERAVGRTMPSRGGRVTAPAPFARRVLEGDARTASRARASHLIRIEIPDDLVHDLSNIAHGLFKPLTGFLAQEDYTSVVHRMRLSDDTPWTIPIVLDIPQATAAALGRTDGAVLMHRGVPVALLDVREVYPFSREELAYEVFGTLDRAHPGVAAAMAMQPFLVGGDVALLNEPDDPFRACRLTPVETAVLFKEKGWRTVVGFQTRNIPHLGHEYVQKTALTFVDGIFINPLLGHKKVGDFKDEVVLKSYQTLIEHYYLRGRTVLSVFRTKMRYAGPREAVFHAIVRRNFGCTHFVVGRDHAGVGGFYPPYAAQEIFQRFPDLGITPLFFTAFFFCRTCGGVVNEKICPHDSSARVEFSGTRLRAALAADAVAVGELIRPEVAAVVRAWPNPFIGSGGDGPGGVL